MREREGDVFSADMIQQEMCRKVIYAFHDWWNLKFSLNIYFEFAP